MYRARDTKLKRDVAIKILPPEFSSNYDRAARFQREAEVLASLNHPNIAAIYDIAEDKSIRFLVLELVEGETLATRIHRGSLPLADVLNIAKQICDALDAAHGKGIVHRDLKPANISVTRDGKVKLLDFGLARIFEQESEQDLSNSPTLLGGSTSGVILGTAAYMSPEQARGETADRRSDIWAFGCVLYEMMTGHAPFEGKMLTEVLGAVIHKDVDWSALPAATPPNLRRLTERCLRKETAVRLRDIGDARLELEEPGGQGQRDDHGHPAKWAWLGWVVAALLAVVTTLGWFREVSGPLNSPDVALTILPPAGTALNRVSGFWPPQISPDGSVVLYFASSGSPFLRRLDSLEPVLLSRLSAAVIYGMFWVPDSKSLIFVTTDYSNLMKVRLPDGAPEVLAALPGITRGATCSDDGIVLVAANDRGVVRLFSVDIGGGDFKAR